MYTYFIYFISGFIITSLCIALSKNNKGKALIRFITQYLRRKIYPKTMILNDGKSIKIDYYFDDRMYSVFLPYNRMLRLSTMGKRVHAVFPEGVIDITQQSCVPYLVTPNMLGASHFLVDNEDGTTKIVGDQYVTVESFN